MLHFTSCVMTSINKLTFADKVLRKFSSTAVVIVVVDVRVVGI